MSHHVHAASPAHPTRASARGSGASRQPRSSRPAAAQNVSTTQTEVDLVDELRTEPDAVDVLRAITDESLRYDGDDGGLLADVDAASPLDIHFGSPFYLHSAREDLVRGVGAPLARRFVAETADEDRIWRPSLDAYTVNEVLDDEEVPQMDRHGLTHIDVMRVDEGADAEDARVQQRLRNIKARLESAVQWEVDGSGEADTAALTSSSSSSSDDAAIERNIHQFLRADGVALPREMRSCGDGGVGEDDAAAQNFSAHDFAMDLLYRSVGGLDDDGRGEDVGSEIHLNAEHLQPKGPIGRGGLLEELASNYCAMLAKDADAIPDVSQWATHHRGCPSMAEVGVDGVSPLEVRRLLAFSVSANPHLRHHLREAAATAPVPQPIDEEEPRAEHTSSTASPPIRCKAPVHPPTAEQSATLLAQQQQLVEKVIAALPRVAPDLTEELARQRRLLEHLTQVQQEHLRRLRREQQAETQARIVAPAYNAAMTTAGAHHAEPRRVFGDVGASSMMQQQQQQPTRQRVSFAHDDVHAPPLIISTAASAPPQPASAAAVAMLEREATYYEKELYRVKDDHQHQLSYERQRRQVEHRAFAEALQQQQRDLTRAHKESIDLLRRDARLKHSEDQHLIERLTAAQGMAHARWEEKQQQRHEASTQRMLDRAVDDIKRVATPSGVSAPQLSSPPTTRRRPISARRGAPPPRKAPRTSSTAAEVEAKEEKEEEEVDVEEVRERTSSEKNVSPSLADATAMPSSVAPPTPLAVVDAASVAGDAASTSSSPYDGAKPMIDRHFRGRIQARLPPEDGDVPSLLPHGLISATKAPAQRKPTQARSSKTGVVASADAAKRLYPYKTQQPRTPATTTRKKPVVSQPKSNTRGEKLREDQRRGTSSTHHQRPMLTPSALRKDGFHHHEEHSIASSHQHQSVQPPQWMYTEQMELSESDGHSIVEQMDLHHRSRIASAAAVGPMMCFVVEQSQAREMARLPTSQVAAEAFRRTQRGGAYPLPVEEPPAGQLLYDHYSLGEEMDGIYTRRWRETQEAADAVRAAEMELRRQRISTSVGADDANYINGAPHVKEMHRVQTGADQAQVKMVDVHEDETLADDARRMTYITPAMAAEARTLREARERLAHLQEIMIRPSSIQHLHDRVVGDEGIMKDVRDRLVSETIYSILGEATEASLFDDVVNALHAEMISAILQHEVLTHAPPPPSQASLMREELDGRLHDHLARAMLEELLADATLLENIPDVAAEDDVEEMHADVLKHHVEVVGEREAMLNALEKVLMGYEGGAARHDDDGDDDDDGRGSSVVEGGAVMHAAMRREVVRVPSVSLVPSISPRRRGAVEDSGIISASLNAPATTAAPATTTHSPRPSRIPVEVCAAADGATTTLAAIETTTTTANDDGNGCIRLVLDLQPMLDHHRDRYRPPPMMSEQTRRTTTNESGAEEDLRDVIVEETRLVRRAALATTPEVAATNFGMISPQTITTTTATTVLDAQAASLMQLHHAQAEMMVRAVCEMEQLQRTAVVEQEALQHDCLLTRLQYLQPMMMASNTTHIHATSSPPSMVAPSADASRHSPPTAPPAMGSATSLVHAAEDAAARTHAVDDVRRAGRPPTTIRDPVTRFIFEWLQEFGDGGAPPPPTMAEELHRAAMMAELQPHVSPQDEEGEGHHRRHRTHRHHDDGSSGSILATSSLLTSTDSSSSPDVHRRICRGSRLLGSPTPQPYPARLHDVRHDGQHSSTTRYTTTAGTTRTTSNSASPSCDVLGIPLPRRSPSATVTTNTTRTSTTNQERMIHAVEEEGEESTNHDEGRGSESSMAALRARYDALMRGGVVRSAAAMDDAPPSREAVAAHHGYMELLATHVHDVQARGRTPTTCAYRMFDGPTLTTLTSAPVVMSRGDAATIEDPLRWRDDPPS